MHRPSLLSVNATCNILKILNSIVVVALMLMCIWHCIMQHSTYVNLCGSASHTYLSLSAPKTMTHSLISRQEVLQVIDRSLLHLLEMLLPVHHSKIRRNVCAASDQSITCSTCFKCCYLCIIGK
jgi:hypothetical protein